MEFESEIIADSHASLAEEAETGRDITERILISESCRALRPATRFNAQLAALSLLVQREVQGVVQVIEDIESAEYEPVVRL